MIRFTNRSAADERLSLSARLLRWLFRFFLIRAPRSPFAALMTALMGLLFARKLMSQARTAQAARPNDREGKPPGTGHTIEGDFHQVRDPRR